MKSERRPLFTDIIVTKFKLKLKLMILGQILLNSIVIVINNKIIYETLVKDSRQLNC